MSRHSEVAFEYYMIYLQQMRSPAGDRRRECKSTFYNVVPTPSLFSRFACSQVLRAGAKILNILSPDARVSSPMKFNHFLTKSTDAITLPGYITTTIFPPEMVLH